MKRDMDRRDVMKKNGEERTWDTYNGVRVLTLPDYPHLADEEVTAKFQVVGDERRRPRRAQHAAQYRDRLERAPLGLRSRQQAAAGLRSGRPLRGPDEAVRDARGHLHLERRRAVRGGERAREPRHDRDD